MITERNKQDYQDSNGKYSVAKFLELHKDFIDPEPMPYQGDRDLEVVLVYLGSDDGISAYIKTPIELVTFNKSNLKHLLYENNTERLSELNRIVATLKTPNLIIKTIEEGKEKHNYFKAFYIDSARNAQFVAVKVCEDGIFYATTIRLQDAKLREKVIAGDIIYDISDPSIQIVESMFKPYNLEERFFDLQQYSWGSIDELELSWLMSTDVAFREVRYKLQDLGYQVKQIYPDQKVSTKYLYAMVNNIQVSLLRIDLYSRSIKDLVQLVLTKYKDIKREETLSIEIDKDILAVLSD